MLTRRAGLFQRQATETGRTLAGCQTLPRGSASPPHECGRGLQGVYGSMAVGPVLGPVRLQPLSRGCRGNSSRRDGGPCPRSLHPQTPDLRDTLRLYHPRVVKQPTASGGKQDTNSGWELARIPSSQTDQVGSPRTSELGDRSRRGKTSHPDQAQVSSGKELDASKKRLF